MNMIESYREYIAALSGDEAHALREKMTNRKFVIGIQIADTKSMTDYQRGLFAGELQFINVFIGEIDSATHERKEIEKNEILKMDERNKIGTIHAEKETLANFIK